jgi:peroxiredoxin Q/BCP
MLKINDKAVEFSLQDQDGNLVNLKDFLGKKILLYFYPKDDTPGCTKEACGFRDLNQELKDLGLIVLGISKDSVKSHKKFAEKYNLNFPILSDESAEIIKKYEVWGKKKFMGREYEGTLRISYLIDEKGKIEKVYDEVDTKEHAAEVLEYLKGIR